MKSDFEKELTELTKHSMENDSDIADFILAKYLSDCLKAFNYAVNDREKWYGRNQEEENQVAIECDRRYFPDC